MHSYLKSIGFSDIKDKKQLDVVLKDVIENYDDKTVVEDRNGHIFVELSKLYGCDIGIAVCGEYDENDQFQMEYYFPYFRGTGVTMQEEVNIEKHAGKESYAGACEDLRIGVTIIFYLQNAGRYLTQRSKGRIAGGVYNVTLSGLAKKGTILLPVMQTEENEKKEKDRMEKGRLIAAARNGDEEAMENLTIEEIDTYSMISQRMHNEDVYSIVDTHFIPYGMECDLYNVMGQITEVIMVPNTDTGDNIYEMRIACNGIEMDVCINKADLLGVPQVGRRFKGIVWLQGYVDFDYL